MTARARTGKSPVRFLAGMFAVVGVIFAAYTAYWVFMRGELEKGVLAWIEDERMRGATVEYDSLRLGGYPFRFALDVDAPVYAPAGLGAWRGERLQMVMQPWNWNHVIARAPGRNVLRDAAGAETRVDLDRRSAGSLSWTGQGLRRLSVALVHASAQDALGRAWAARDFQLHLRPPPGDRDSLQVVLQWDALTLPDSPPDAPWLGADVQASRLLLEIKDAFPVIDAGGSLRDWARRGGEADVAQLLVNWGPAKLGAKADLSLDTDGLVDGAIDVRLDEGEALIEALAGSGLAPEAFAQASMAVTMLDAASEGGGFLTLTVRDGSVRYLGQEIAALPPAPL